MVSRFKQLYARVHSAAVTKVIYDDGELRIQGFDRHGSLVIELRFPDFLLIRLSDEGLRLKLLKELGPTRSFVLLEEKSKLLSWLDDECLQTRDTKNAKHFIVIIGEEIVDVVSVSDPQIHEVDRGPSQTLQES